MEDLKWKVGLKEMPSFLLTFHYHRATASCKGDWETHSLVGTEQNRKRAGEQPASLMHILDIIRKGSDMENEVFTKSLERLEMRQPWSSS